MAGDWDTSLEVLRPTDRSVRGLPCDRSRRPESDKKGPGLGPAATRVAIVRLVAGAPFRPRPLLTAIGSPPARRTGAGRLSSLTFYLTAVSLSPCVLYMKIV